MYLDGRSLKVWQRLRATNVEDIVVCSVVKAELYYGAWKSNNSEKTLAKQQRFLAVFESLPFDDKSAQTAGKIRAQLAAMGTPIGSYDLQIAAIALTNNLTLVTHNTPKFNRASDLKLEDWEAQSICYRHLQFMQEIF